MTDLEIRVLDAADGARFDAFYDVYLAAELASGEGVGSPWMREEVRADYAAPATRRRLSGFVGSRAGRVVVVGQLSTPLLDNPRSAMLAVHVDPTYARAGLGSAMLRRLEAEALAAGRTVLNAEAAWPFEAGGDGAGTAPVAFARAHGYALALSDVKRSLPLPVDDAVLAGLAEEAAQHAASFSLRSWVGPVPDELLASWARLTSTLATEAPQGELVLEAESTDPALVRAGEELLVAQGRTKYNTVALDAAGDLVAYTDLATTVHEPGRAYQWGTLVRADARGHRLGLAVKVANLRLLQRERPDVVTVTTYNAESNAHMVGVNERLGFVPVGRLGEFQKLL